MLTIGVGGYGSCLSVVGGTLACCWTALRARLNDMALFAATASVEAVDITKKRERRAKRSRVFLFMFIFITIIIIIIIL